MSDKKNKIDIDHVAKLANLPLDDSEKILYEGQLIKIVDYIDQIERKANTSNVEPTFNVSLNINTVRKDISGTSLTQQEATQNANDIVQGQFSTKGVFENE